jgi:hypothetical protein
MNTRPKLSWELRAEAAEAEVAKLRAAQEALRAALTKARTFITYARYELQDGLATLGDQFPRQGDADVVVAQIDDALARLTAAPPYSHAHEPGFYPPPVRKDDSNG